VADDDLRSLERLAEQGDPEAARRAEVIRERLGAPLLWQLVIVRAVPVPAQAATPPAPPQFTRERWDAICRQQEAARAERRSAPPMRRNPAHATQETERTRHLEAGATVWINPTLLTALREVRLERGVIARVREDGFEYVANEALTAWVPRDPQEVARPTGPIEGYSVIVRAYGEGHAREVASIGGEHVAWLDPQRTTCVKLLDAGEVGEVLRARVAGEVAAPWQRERRESQPGIHRGRGGRSGPR
jgi:hypothetical protein